MFVFLALSIWGVKALDSRGAKQCLALPEEAGCQDFHMIFKVNVVVGFIYTALHGISWPIAMLAIFTIDIKENYRATRERNLR